mgnify:FL=1
MHITDILFDPTNLCIIVFYSNLHLTTGRHLAVCFLKPLHVIPSLAEPGVEQVRVCILMRKL